jgi:hypothetical protein
MLAAAVAVLVTQLAEQAVLAGQVEVVLVVVAQKVLVLVAQMEPPTRAVAVVAMVVILAVQAVQA